MQQWEHFQHGADIGVRGLGDTPAEAFAAAATALTAVVTPPAGVAALREVRIRCEEPDLEFLLYAWLNAVIYQMAGERLLFSRFAVTLAGTTLEAVLRGEPVDTERHAPAVEVKAATFHQLKVERRPDGLWVAQCVVDV